MTTTKKKKSSIFDLADGLSEEFKLYASPTSHKIVADDGEGGNDDDDDDDDFNDDDDDDDNNGIYRYYDEDTYDDGLSNYDGYDDLSYNDDIYLPSEATSRQNNRPSIAAATVVATAAPAATGRSRTSSAVVSRPVVVCSAAARAAADRYGKMYSYTQSAKITAAANATTTTATVTVTKNSSSATAESCSHRHSEAVAETLKGWLSKNLHNPYPNNDDIEHLRKSTGLNKKQIKIWFYNARRRVLGKVRAKLDVKNSSTKSTSNDEKTHDHHEHGGGSGSIEGFEHYMRTVLKYSDKFVKRVLKHSKLLLAGRQEIKYRTWPDHVAFHCNILRRDTEEQQQQDRTSPTSSCLLSSSSSSLTHFNFLDADFDSVAENMETFERTYGRCPKNDRYLFMFPIQKLRWYQQYLRTRIGGGGGGCVCNK